MERQGNRSAGGRNIAVLDCFAERRKERDSERHVHTWNICKSLSVLGSGCMIQLPHAETATSLRLTSTLSLSLSLTLTPALTTLCGETCPASKNRSGVHTAGAPAAGCTNRFCTGQVRCTYSWRPSCRLYKQVLYRSGQVYIQLAPQLQVVQTGSVQVRSGVHTADAPAAGCINRFCTYAQAPGQV